MKHFRFSISDLRLAIGLVCLIAGVAHAQQYNATIVVTNNPSHGHTLTVISGTTTNTRTWVTNVTAAATQIAISNSVAASATNLWIQTAANPWTATTYSYQTTNGIVLFQHGTAISASLLTNWGSITLTTNTTSTAYTLRLPITAEPNAQHRTNQANRVVALLNDYGTDTLDASVLGLSAYITNNQTGVTLGGTFSGNGASLTNIPLAGLQIMPLTNNQTGVTLGGTFSGSFAGNLASGTNLPLAGLQIMPLTNNQTGVTLDGTFSGDGSGLTGLSADSTNALFTVQGPGSTGTNTATSTLVFTGDGVSVASNAATATVTIPGVSGGRTILSNITLAANVASIVFTNIAADYSSLEMELFLHNSDAADSRRVNIRFNGSTNAYDYQQISAVSTTVAGEIVQDAQQGELGFAAANNNAVYRFSPIHVEIPFYAGAGEKLYFSQNAEKSGSGSTQFALRRYVGWWSQTNAITWIELLPASGNFTTNSRAILYGID